MHFPSSSLTSLGTARFLPFRVIPCLTSGGGMSLSGGGSAEELLLLVENETGRSEVVCLSRAFLRRYPFVRP